LQQKISFFSGLMVFSLKFDPAPSKMEILSSLIFLGQSFEIWLKDENLFSGLFLYF
jgi:hypothetical protein